MGVRPTKELRHQMGACALLAHEIAVAASAHRHLQRERIDSDEDVKQRLDALFNVGPQDKDANELGYMRRREDDTRRRYAEFGAAASIELKLDALSNRVSALEAALAPKTAQELYAERFKQVFSE